MNTKLCACVAFFFASGILCAGSAIAGEKQTLKFSEVDSGIDSGIDDKTEFVIRSDSEWKTFWTKHKSRQLPVPAAPKIDFKKDMVIAVIAGSKPSGGYGAKITSIEKTDKELLVDATLTKPRPGGISAQMMTQPFDIVKCLTAPGALKIEWKESN